MDNDSEDDDDSYSSEQEASDDAVQAQVGARTRVPTRLQFVPAERQNMLNKYKYRRTWIYLSDG